jgi:hypothetical protein
VSVPPVVKLTPESVGEVSDPEPETVASTVPRSTVAVRAAVLELLLLLLFTDAYAAPAPVSSTRPSTEFNRTALRRRGSTFMAHRLARCSGEALGGVWEFAGYVGACPIVDVRTYAGRPSASTRMIHLRPHTTTSELPDFIQATCTAVR